jgi:glucosamine--fructose-6-phosphate aminotransferase (isomerizing)
MCSLLDDKLVLTKHASAGFEGADCIDRVISQSKGLHDEGKLAVAHTRWATHGAKTDTNAHPHTDLSGNLAVVHNGMVQNNNELEKILEEAGIEKRSETDSEIIPLLIEHYMTKEGLSTYDALEKVWGKMEGSNAVLLMNKQEPEKLYMVKKGSPLYVGVLEDGYIVASETSAFSNYTQEFIDPKEDRIVVLDISEGSPKVETGNQIQKASGEVIHVEPAAPYDTFFEWEINQQPEALMRALNYGARITFHN